ncbi:efflux RND transporter periplasmic adaptor subunit [Prosthecomicrobium sp. N25]|uniref:efflux RND transporter periplasmic adaptor subunit n=1 Tax=Prosthecomicrobium sp. N25 TaxID=3129254 RepID=UPI003076C0E3
MSAIIHSPKLVTVPVLVALGLSLAGCKEEVSVAPEPPRPVKTLTVAAAAAERTLTYSGAVEARVSAALGFRVPGKIVERSVDVGDRVTAGQVVARIDPADLGLALQAAEANVEGAKARVEVAQDALARTRTLFDKGHVAKAALDKAALEADQAAAALDAARSARDQARNQSLYAELKADGPGIVTEVRAEAGQVVLAGTPVVVVARDGEKEVRVAVPEQEIRHLAPGQSVAVGYWADPALRQEGRVREVAGSADPASRTFSVRVTLPDDPGIRLGQTATVSVAVPTAAAGVAVPLSALAEANGRPVVWVVDPATATVRSRVVEVGPVTPDGTRVTAGLVPGDKVVTAGTQFMVEGRKVRLDGPLATAALAP